MQSYGALICVVLLVITAADASNGGWKFRLFGGQYPNEGLLQVLPPRETDWGTVCIKAKDVSAEVALAACASAGFIDNSSGNVNLRVHPSVYTLSQGFSSGPIYLSSLRCDSKAPTLTSCFYSYSSDGTSPTCTHADDMYLRCLETESSYDVHAKQINNPNARLLTELTTIEKAPTSVLMIGNLEQFRLQGFFALSLYLKVSMSRFAVTAVKTILSVSFPFTQQLDILNLTFLVGSSSDASFHGSGGNSSNNNDLTAEELTQLFVGMNGRAMFASIGISQLIDAPYDVKITPAFSRPCQPMYAINSNSSQLMNVFGLIEVQYASNQPVGTICGLLRGGIEEIFDRTFLPSFEYRQLTSRLICEAVNPGMKGSFAKTDLIPNFLSNNNGPITGFNIDCLPSAVGKDGSTYPTSLSHCNQGSSWLNSSLFCSHEDDIGIICGRNLLPPTSPPLVFLLGLMYFTPSRPNETVVNYTAVNATLQTMFQTWAANYSIPYGRVQVSSVVAVQLPIFDIFVNFTIAETTNESEFTRTDLELILTHVDPEALCGSFCTAFSTIGTNSSAMFSNFVDPILPPPAAVGGEPKVAPACEASITITRTLLGVEPPATAAPTTPTPVTILLLTVASNMTSSTLQSLLLQEFNSTAAQISVNSQVQSGSNSTFSIYAVSFQNNTLATVVLNAVGTGSVSGVYAAAPQSTVPPQQDSSSSAAVVAIAVGAAVGAVALIGAGCFFYRRGHDDRTSGKYDDDGVMLSNVGELNINLAEPMIQQNRNHV